MGLVKIPAMIEASGGGADTPDISPDGSGRSLQFGAPVGESLGDDAMVCKHLRNNFSIMYWSKHPLAAAAKTFFLMDEDGQTGRVHASSTSGITMRFRMSDPGASPTSQSKDYTFSIGTGALWKQIVIVVDIGADNPTNEQVIIYVNGVKVTPTKNVDTVLSNRDGSNMTSCVQWGLSLSNEHSVAIWDKILKANEVLKIYNNGKGNFDLSRRQGKYRSQKRLQHWFFWDTTNFANVNRDYGKARTYEFIHLLDDSSDVTSADLVIDAPGY